MSSSNLNGIRTNNHLFSAGYDEVESGVVLVADHNLAGRDVQGSLAALTDLVVGLVVGQDPIL